MKLEKVTEEGLPPKRWYDDACGTALAMELIGERWSLLIVRELMFGPRRFGELRGGLPGISANVLTQRLTGLEQSGILCRHTLPPPAAVQVYELTRWGYESERAMQELGRWAVRSPRHDPSLPLSGASLMMSFRTMFSAARAGNLVATIGFRLGRDTFVARIGSGEIAITRDVPKEADVTFEAADPPLVAAAVYGGQPLDALAAAGLLTTRGDRALAERFCALFPLPDKLPA